MLDKVKQKLQGSSSDADNAGTTGQQPNKSSTSVDEASAASSTRHQSEASEGRLSTSEERGRSESLAPPTAGGETRTGTSKSRSRSRARDVLWKNSLFDSSNPQGNSPKDPNVRGKSLSVAQPHPTMVEEGMKNMPYTDWSKK